MKSLSRRQLLTGAAGAAAVCIATPARARPLQKVKMTTSWILGTLAISAVAAREMGFWKQRGYDVEIARGHGSNSSIQSVNQRHYDIGWSLSTGAMIVQKSKGVGVQSVGQMMYRDSMGVLVPENSPIKTPKDLEGKTIGVTQTSSEVPFIPAFFKNAGVDASKVKIVSMNAEVRQRALLDKKIDAMTDSALTAIPPLLSRGTRLRNFAFANYGLRIYSTSLQATSKMVQEQPEMIQDVVDGAYEGMKWTLLNPEEAVAMFVEAYPEMALGAASRENHRIGLGIARYSALSAEVRDHGFGYADPKMFETMNDYIEKFITKSGVKPPTEKLFTNRFAGRIRFTDAEWAKANSLASEFGKYLG
jgi:NitT/TauT family transport system substrate-binding protein